MAHHKAKNAWPGRKNVLLDHSPFSISHARPAINTDHSPSPDDLNILFQNYLFACRVEEKSKLTLQTYHRRLGAFLEFLQKQNLPLRATQLTNHHVRLFLFHLQQKLNRDRKLQPTTIHAYYRALKTFFNWLVDEGVLDRSPMQNIKPPKLPKVRPKPFSEDDMARLLLLCSGQRFVDIRNRAMILLFWDTGLRLTEMANLQLKDLDFDNGTVRVLGKGDKERLVHMGKETQKALLRYLFLRRDEHPCLWVNESRKPLSRHGIQVMIKKLCLRAGLTGVKRGPHTFRHTAAINCLRNGMGEFTLQTMLGHSTLTMTRHYVESLNAEDIIRVHRTASPVDNFFSKLRNNKTGPSR